MLGPEQNVAMLLGRAGLQFAQGTQRLRLPLAPLKTVFLATSTGLAEKLERTWAQHGFKRKFHARNLGLDALAGGGRRAKIANKRLRDSAKRSGRLLKLGKNGRKLCRVQRAGPTAVALWGSATLAIPDAPLHRLRVATLRSLVRLPRGVSVGLKLSSFKAGRKADPARFHHGQVFMQWAVAVWEDYPRRAVLQTCLEVAAQKLACCKRPWKAATDPACAYLLTAARIGWRPISAHIILTDLGRRLDLTRVSPKLVERLAQQASLRWSDRRSLSQQLHSQEGAWSAPIDW